MKQNIIVLLILLFLTSARCSPDVPLPTANSSPTRAQRTIISATNTSHPTIEPTIQAPRVPQLTPFIPLPVDEETAQPIKPFLNPLTITIVYDNIPFDERLKPAWGFAALVEYQGHTLLFDTGGDGPVLMENMRVLGIDPGRIEGVVLSHAHGDHTGGLTALLDYGGNPVVYIPCSFSAAFKKQVRDRTEVVEVAPGQMIAEGIFSTGEMGQDIFEQALVIQTETGLVIITGCAHPGITSIVKQAQFLFDQSIRLVLGGFHLGNHSQADIDAILSEFRRLKVEQVAPCHCTGAQAIEMFASEYGEDFLKVGVGGIIRLDIPPQ